MRSSYYSLRENFRNFRKRIFWFGFFTIPSNSDISRKLIHSYFNSIKESFTLLKGYFIYSLEWKLRKECTNAFNLFMNKSYLFLKLLNFEICSFRARVYLVNFLEVKYQRHFSFFKTFWSSTGPNSKNYYFFVR
jgi:hypothetical protein